MKEKEKEEEVKRRAERDEEEKQEGEVQEGRRERERKPGSMEFRATESFRAEQLLCPSQYQAFWASASAKTELCLE